MQNKIDNANGDVPLIVENVFFWEEKQNLSIVFFMKKIFIL